MRTVASREDGASLQMFKTVHISTIVMHTKLFWEIMQGDFTMPAFPNLFYWCDSIFGMINLNGLFEVSLNGEAGF